MVVDIPQDWLFPPLDRAADVQRELAQRVICSDHFQAITKVGGADVSNNPRDPAQLIYAALVTLDAQSLSVIDNSSVVEKQTFPYIPGFLGFREAPALVNAFSKLHQLPDLLFVDGHGISHPRGLGIASHIGVLLDIPTVGVAKSILVGRPAGELNDTPGATVPLVWKGKTIGMCVRTKKRSLPLIVAPGHRVSMETAVELVLRYCRGYRLPEVTRQAHLAANAYRRQALKPTEA